MATQTQILDFIAKIAPCAQFAYKAVGKILPSVCIGMACVESAYGTSKIMASHNAFLGQKVGSGKTATRYWSGAFYTSKTKEEYTVGTHTVITDAFRAYDSMQQCVLNYYELLNTHLYAGVWRGVSYKTQMQQIKQCGYMTSSTEVNSVIKVIEKYNLTQYDVLPLSDLDAVANEAREQLGLKAVEKNGNPYSEPTKNVKMGSKGNDARWLQYALNKAGAYHLIVDGIAGAKTIAALTDFQSAHGLDPDGICGAKTRARLKELTKEG